MATRLNKATRESVARAIVRHAHGKAATAMRDEMASLAEETLIFLLGDQRELFDRIPPEWLESASGLNVNVAGNRYFLNFTGLTYADPLGPYVARDTVTNKWWRIPYSIIHNIHVINLHSPLSMRIEAHENRRSDLKSKIKTAYDTALRVLKRFSSVEQAIKEWPEAEKFLTPYKQAPTVRLPAVISADINRVLNLPPEGDDNETDLHK